MSLRSFDQSSSISGHRTGDDGLDSALRGASLAFKNTPSPSRGYEINTYSGVNGALAAATKAGRDAGRTMDSRRPSTIASPADGPGPQSLKAGRDAFNRRASSTLQQEEQLAMQQPHRRQSPSLIAATLAAARATPAPSTLSRESTGAMQHLRAGSGMEQNDESPIPATNKLVELFEAKKRSQSPLRAAKTTPAARIVSPTPIRPRATFLPVHSPTSPVSPGTSTVHSRPPLSPAPIQITKQRQSQPANNVANTAKQVPAKLPVGKGIQMTSQPRDAMAMAPAKPQAPRSEVAPSPIPIQTSKVAPTVPPPRRSTSLYKRKSYGELKHIKSPAKGPESDSSSDSFTSAKEALSRSNTLQKSPTLSRRNTRTDRNSITSNKPFLPPPPPKPLALQTSGNPETLSFSPPPKPPTRPSSTVSARRSSAHSLKPQLTADSLANAMVASSLASSRVPSPSKSRPTPPPPRRLHRNHHSFNFLGTSSPVSRAPSPLKSKNQTLRSAPSSPSEDEHEQHHRNMFKRKHPNKHNEGNRRRWMDTITEAERKRYEGIWASNRGASVDIEGTDVDEVHGLVVKDIWQRSGLSSWILEAIWELVVDFGSKTSERRVLRKEEFVVGTWLVDQCLKGRKLPYEVGPSVWDSVKKLIGGIRTR